MLGAILGYWTYTWKKKASDKAFEIHSNEMSKTDSTETNRPSWLPEGASLPFSSLIGSKRLLLDESEFTKALSEAQKGDLEYMTGLIDWYFRHGQDELAEYWLKREAEERRARGLPSFLDIMPPKMNQMNPRAPE